MLKSKADTNRRTLSALAKIVDTIYQALFTKVRKTSLAGLDRLLIRDSADSFAYKYVLATDLPSGGGSGVTSFNTRTGIVIPVADDYTWAQIDKTVSDIADITTKSHTSLTDIGVNTHIDIDTHLALTNEHIDWTNATDDLLTTGSVYVDIIGEYTGSGNGVTVDGVLLQDNEMSIDYLGNPTQDNTISYGAHTLTWQFTNPFGGVLYNWIGAASGHLFELRQETGVPSAGTHLLHLEAVSSNVVLTHWEHGSATDRSVYFSVTGDTLGVARLQIQADGKMEWGDGTNAVDTNLYRSASDILATDDNFSLNELSKLYLDGGGDTYIVGTTSDSIEFIAGGTVYLDIDDFGGQEGVYLKALSADEAETYLVSVDNTSGLLSKRSVSGLGIGGGDVSVGTGDNAGRVAVWSGSGEISGYADFTYNSSTYQFTREVGGNSVTYIGTYYAKTSVTPGAGLGVGFKYALENSTPAEHDAAEMYVVWTSPTAGSEYADMVFETMVNGAMTETLKLSGGDLYFPGTLNFTDTNTQIWEDVSGNLSFKDAVLGVTKTLTELATVGTGTVTSVSAGNGLDFTTITTTGSVTMGTPTTLTASTTNAVSAGTHEHEITGFSETSHTHSTSNIVNDVTDASSYIVYVDTIGQQVLNVDTGALLYNATTGGLSATSFTGAGTGLTGTAASLTAGNSTVAATVTVADESAAFGYPLFSTNPTGDVPLKTDISSLTYNSSSGLLSATTFSGAGTNLTGTAASLTVGNATLATTATTATTATLASTITVADESADTTCFPLFVTAATGSLAAKTGSNLAFNSSNGILTVTNIYTSGGQSNFYNTADVSERFTIYTGVDGFASLYHIDETGSAYKTLRLGSAVSTQGIEIDGSTGDIGLKASTGAYAIVVGGTIAPDTDSSYDLGAATVVWQNIYAEQFVFEKNVATDDTARGVITYWQTNVTTTFGDAMYIDTDSDLNLADADAASTMPAIGLCVQAGSVGLRKVLTHGVVTNTAWTWTIGAEVYVSTTGTTGNTLTQTAPSGSGDQVQVIGIAINANSIFVNPSLSTITV